MTGRPFGQDPVAVIGKERERGGVGKIAEVAEEIYAYHTETPFARLSLSSEKH